MLAVPLATCCERPIPNTLWIEHIRTNRDILGEADARHCQPPGAWRIVVHDLSPFDPNASFKGLGRFDGSSVPHKYAHVLGTNLKRSESGCLVAENLFRMSTAPVLTGLRAENSGINGPVWSVPTAGPLVPLDRVAQIADHKYCRPHARAFRLRFARVVTVFPVCPPAAL
jgi:hypothetical protein